MFQIWISFFYYYIFDVKHIQKKFNIGNWITKTYFYKTKLQKKEENKANVF